MRLRERKKGGNMTRQDVLALRGEEEYKRKKAVGRGRGRVRVVKLRI